MPEGVVHLRPQATARPGLIEPPRLLPQPQAEAPLARLRGVVLRRQGETLLDGLDLDIPAEGGVTALMGPNGAGKSLTLRLLAGLLRPCRGAVELTVPPAARGLVFQSPVLLRRSVRANLAHALRLARVPRAERRDRLDALLALGRLRHLAERPARALSGGEQQRVALTRALAARPRLLLLDEPTASLDPQATAAIEAIVAGAVAGGTRAVLVTHDRGQAARLAGDVVFLHAGQAVEAGSAGPLLAAPRSAPARAYLEGRLFL